MKVTGFSLFNKLYTVAPGYLACVRNGNGGGVLRLRIPR